MFKSSFKRRVSVALATLMLCSCRSKGGDGIFKRGTYTGVSANGRNGEIKVEVMLSADKIESVTVGENSETAGIADPAIEKIPERIVEAQSLDVDTVAGATITSNAILEAVSDAITQAGADPTKLVANTGDKEVKEETLDANIVVVGGGAAGLATAVSAAYEGETDIILLEKMSALGGNAIRSGGFIEDLNPGDDRAIEMTDSYTKTIEDMLQAGPQDDDEKTVWDDLVKAYDEYKASGKTTLFDCPALLAIEYHRVEGSDCESNMPYGEIVNTFDDWFINEVGAKMSKMVGIVGYTWPRWTYPTDYTRGNGYFAYLTQYIKDKDLDITIMTETPATELLTDENGAVTGVKAESADGTIYTINAKKVVLATGGFSANGEMLMEYDTQWGITTPDIKTDNNPGNTGDGITMAQKLGGATAAMDNIMMFPLSTKGNSDASGAFGFNGSSNLMINTKGVRFVDETASRFEICHAVFEQEEPYYYIISDALNSRVDKMTEEELQKSIDAGVVFKGDTLEELAEKIGVDADTLKATIEQYNTACETSDDKLFGRTSFADGSEIVQGPFYATALEPCSHITIGGLVVDDNYAVLTNDGKPIENLYAVGETIVGSCGLSAFAYGKDLGARLANAN